MVPYVQAMPLPDIYAETWTNILFFSGNEVTNACTDHI